MAGGFSEGIGGGGSTSTSSPLYAYNPTFLQPIKGSFNKDANFVSLNVGTDAYVTEREVNEMQWIQVERAANTLRHIAKSGIVTIDKTNKFAECFQIVNNDETNLNGFELPPFESVCDGYLVHHEEYHGSPTITPQNIKVRLPNPPIGGYRHDFVFLEYWFAELKKNDDVPKWGYIYNQKIPFHIIDERIMDETSHRIQLRWTISHYEDYDDWCENGFIKPDGTPNPKIHPLPQTGWIAPGYHYVQTEHDPYLFRAGVGMSSTVHTADGYVYAIPLFNIFRFNNSGFNAAYNPFGGVDYVDSTTVCDRPDNKFSNIIYTDQITDLRHLSALGEEQYDKIYVRQEDYYKHLTITRNKIMNMSYEYWYLKNILRNIDIDLPSIHDLEIYGHEMIHQWGLTNGAGLDPLDEDRKIVYKKHNKYYVGKRLEKKNYCVVPTCIDYDLEDAGTIGDVYINKYPTKFRLYNTGAKNLRMNLEAFFVDGEVVMSGEGVFSGMDGTPIDMPFKMDDDRYFVSITALDNTNGRNGEIFVKLVEKQIFVYNTGLKTSSVGTVVSTTGNKFQWVVIDMQSPEWKNSNYVNVKLDGHNGVQVSTTEFGEHYRLNLGTPIVPTSVLIDQGSIGDIYADIDEDDLFTVYNTGKAGATVQCFIFNDVEYVDYYDTQPIPVPVDVPNIVQKEFEYPMKPYE